MRKSLLFIGSGLFLPLLVSCGGGDHSEFQQPALSGKEAFITETNAETAAGETSVIVDLVNLMGNTDERLLAASDIVLPCGAAGYGGTGTIILQGKLQQPGDTMKITFNGCTLADAPLSGMVKATLVEYRQDDEKELFSTRYSYNGFQIGSGASLFTVDGELTVESRYVYSTETSITTRRSNSLQLTQGRMIVTVDELDCVDTYTGLWDTAPYSMECHLRFESSALGGTVSVKTVEPFRGIGGENRPTSGEMHIEGANSQMRLLAQEDGEHILLQWDQDGDDRYEGQLLRTWDELKRDLLGWDSFLNP